MKKKELIVKISSICIIVEICLIFFNSLLIGSACYIDSDSSFVYGCYNIADHSGLFNSLISLLYHYGIYFQITYLFLAISGLIITIIYSRRNNIKSKLLQITISIVITIAILFIISALYEFLI